MGKKSTLGRVMEFVQFSKSKLNSSLSSDPIRRYNSHSLKEDIREKSRLAKYACEEVLWVSLEEAKIFGTHSNNRYVKYNNRHMLYA